MADVVVVATSPAIDRIALASASVNGGIVRTEKFLETPGGKGTHVAMVAGRLGADVALVAPAGGAPGRLFEELLAAEGVPNDLVRVDAPTRGTYTLVDPTRADLFEVHEPPMQLEASETKAMIERARHAVRGAAVAVVAGGLPRQAPPGLHAEIVRAAREAGAVSVVDTSSPPALEKALEAGADIAVPNLAEANAASGNDLSDEAPLAEITRLGLELLEPGGAAAVLTLGPRGSLVVSREGEAWHVSAPVVGRAVNAVGCGDALVGGLAAGLLERRSLRDAVALGAAAAADKLTRLHSGRVDAACVREIVDRVEVSPVT